jgi:hypothetical protein
MLYRNMEILQNNYRTRSPLLRGALGFVTLCTAPRHPALDALHEYLDSWRGVGAIVDGMHHQGWDLELTEYESDSMSRHSSAPSKAHISTARAQIETATTPTE